jgi:hypothetical protein
MALKHTKLFTLITRLLKPILGSEHDYWKRRLVNSSDYEQDLIDAVAAINIESLRDNYRPFKGVLVKLTVRDFDMMAFCNRVMPLAKGLVSVENYLIPTKDLDRVVQHVNLDAYMTSDDLDYIDHSLALERFVLTASNFLKETLKCRHADSGPDNYNYNDYNWRVSKSIRDDIEEIVLAILKIQE